MSPVCSLSSRRNILCSVSSLYHMMILTGPGVIYLIGEKITPCVHGEECVMMTTWPTDTPHIFKP